MAESAQTETAALTPVLPRLMIEDAVRAALLEDLGRAGDITTAARPSRPRRRRRPCFRAAKAGVVCGLPLAGTAFRLLDPATVFTPLVEDGARVQAGDVIARIEGNARAMLSAERVALNFLMHLSGIASYTASFAGRVAHTEARICDTRKTMPGLRAIEKYAVRCGGGSNHRYGLDDAILIKDNHVAVAGGVAKAVHAARAYAGHLVRIEVEVDTLDQLREALEAGADVILLDNMPPQVLAQAVKSMRAGRSSKPPAGLPSTPWRRSPNRASTISPPRRSPWPPRRSILGSISQSGGCLIGSPSFRRRSPRSALPGISSSRGEIIRWQRLGANCGCRTKGTASSAGQSLPSRGIREQGRNLTALDQGIERGRLSSLRGGVGRRCCLRPSQNGQIGQQRSPKKARQAEDRHGFRIRYEILAAPQAVVAP